MSSTYIQCRSTFHKDLRFCFTPLMYTGLFPIQERGLNPCAQPLTPHEIEEMSRDDQVMDRLLRAYIMVCVGCVYLDVDSRCWISTASTSMAGNSNALPSMQNDVSPVAVPHLTADKNLQNDPHNLLRITRMIKCLGEFKQLEIHVVTLILFFLSQNGEGYLDFTPKAKGGVWNPLSHALDMYWVQSIRSKELRYNLQFLTYRRGSVGAGSPREAWFDTRANVFFPPKSRHSEHDDTEHMCKLYKRELRRWTEKANWYRKWLPDPAWKTDVGVRKAGLQDWFRPELLQDPVWMTFMRDAGDTEAAYMKVCLGSGRSGLFSTAEAFLQCS